MRITTSSGCLILALYASLHPTSASQFSSHVTINTPGGRVSHGVGNPIGTPKRFFGSPQFGYENFRQPHFNGYSRMKPLIPFNNEEIDQGNALDSPPWQYNSFSSEEQIPVLPPSPYRVDSPDPESLWPEGLFLPPLSPTHFGPKFERRSGDNGQVLLDQKPLDPYLLEGSAAVAAVHRAKKHGELYFHEIPHINSLLENQQLRISNGLEEIKIRSARNSWLHYRP